MLDVGQIKSGGFLANKLASAAGYISHLQAKSIKIHRVGVRKNYVSCFDRRTPDQA
jgi:hypothetical protein